jgi:acetyl-CoA carboxylase biotin carboxylase subunit
MNSVPFAHRIDASAFASIRRPVIPPYYDSLVAKLIAHGKDRNEAIQRMKRALDLFIVEGIYTSIPLHKRILSEPDFIAGTFDTNFIKRWMP